MNIYRYQHLILGKALQLTHINIISYEVLRDRCSSYRGLFYVSVLSGRFGIDVSKQRTQSKPHGKSN